MSDRTDKRATTRSGTERAAILLLTLGEQEAAQVLKHMGAKEVQRIGAAMAQLVNVSRDEVTAVLSEFSTTVLSQTSVGVGVDEFLRKVLVNALGEDKASSVIDRINIGRTSKGLEALKWMDARAVAELIRLEHPQIIAIVLAYLDPDQAAEILGHLPDTLARRCGDAHRYARRRAAVRALGARRCHGETVRRQVRPARPPCWAAPRQRQTSSIPGPEPGERAHGADPGKPIRPSARASRI